MEPAVWSLRPHRAKIGAEQSHCRPRTARPAEAYMIRKQSIKQRVTHGPNRTMHDVACMQILKTSGQLGQLTGSNSGDANTRVRSAPHQLYPIGSWIPFQIICTGGGALAIRQI